MYNNDYSTWLNFGEEKLTRCFDLKQKMTTANFCCLLRLLPFEAGILPDFSETLFRSGRNKWTLSWRRKSLDPEECRWEVLMTTKLTSVAFWGRIFYPDFCPPWQKRMSVTSEVGIQQNRWPDTLQLTSHSASEVGNSWIFIREKFDFDSKTGYFIWGFVPGRLTIYPSNERSSNNFCLWTTCWLLSRQWSNSATFFDGSDDAKYEMKTKKMIGNFFLKQIQSPSNV